MPYALCLLPDIIHKVKVNKTLKNKKALRRSEMLLIFLMWRKYYWKKITAFWSGTEKNNLTGLSRQLLTNNYQVAGICGVPAYSFDQDDDGKAKNRKVSGDW